MRHVSTRHARSALASARTAVAIAAFSPTIAVAQGDLATQFFTSAVNLPIHLAAPDGEANVFVAEQLGRIWVVEPTGARLPVPYVDFSSEVLTNLTAGFVGFTFHPDYASNGFVYVFFTTTVPAGTHATVLHRYTRSATDPYRADPGSRVELLRIPQPHPSHAGGSMEFGPDGMLYISIGDGGIQQDPGCRAQSGDLFGGVLRIDVDAGFPYAIPPDNPFVSVPGVANEFWHRGLRHPWRICFDEATGEMYIGENGQALWEEIDWAPAGVGGLNFGWNQMEGAHCFAGQGCPPGTPPCNDPAYTDPIHEYVHGALGVSVIGGRVYNGSAIPGLVGHYIYGDWLSGRFWTFRFDGIAPQDLVERTAELAPGGGRVLDQIASIGKDAAGELYILEHGGNEIYRIVRRCGVTRVCETSPNSVGPGAIAGWGGTVSVTANDLMLDASGAPPSTFGLFFYSPELGPPTTVGNGSLCLNGGAVGYFRLPVVQADALGTMRFQVDYTVHPMASGPGQVQAGATWNFQAWYRDVGGPGGASFNLTDGLSVLFCP